VDLFDGPFFRMSRGEAAALDPQTRLLLQVTQEAFIDAGGCTRDLWQRLNLVTGFPPCNIVRC
jgi:acyl transferase domain-containing protein